jgi:hypothetical protein
MAAAIYSLLVCIASNKPKRSDYICVYIYFLLNLNVLIR